MTTRPAPRRRLKTDPLDWAAPPTQPPVPSSAPPSDQRTPIMADLPMPSSHFSWEHLTRDAGMELLSTPIMVTDSAMVIRYVNSAATEMFAAIEDDVRRDLPHFRAREIQGKLIDVFHKDPSHQHRMIAAMTGPVTGGFTIGGQSLWFRAVPLTDPQGNHGGVVVEWRNETEIKHWRSQVDLLIDRIRHMTEAHFAGDIDVFIAPEGFGPEMQQVGSSVNEMVLTHINTKRRIIDCAEAFARGDFDYPLEQFPRKRAFINTAIEAIRASSKAVLGEIRRLSQAVIDGKLDIETDPSKYSGDYRAIIEAFYGAFDSLNTAFQTIKTQSDEINSTVEMMSHAAQSMSTNAQIQSASVDQISASAEETDAQVKANAEAAASTNALVTGASEVAEAGKEKIVEMVKAMEDISNSSQDIAKIIKVIDEIAFQTNLLALNAAVEAARAGQHGRGFAVVAQEVRNLAGRSAKAARETSDLIDDAGKRVRLGVRIASETNAAFSQIAEDIEQVQTLVRNIAKASDEQSRGVAQINSALMEVAKTALSNSQQADEFAATTAEMGAATEHMRKEVSRFSLRKQRPAPEAVSQIDMLTPELIDQLRRLFAQEAALTPARKPVEAVQSSGGTRDHDERGFENF